MRAEEGQRLRQGRSQHHGRGVASADHAEVGQRDGRAAQLLGRDLALLHVGAHAVEAAPQIRGVAISHVAQRRHEEPFGRVDRDPDLDLGDEPARSGLAVGH